MSDRERVTDSVESRIAEYAAWRDWEGEAQQDLTMLARALLALRKKVAKVPHLWCESHSEHFGDPQSHDSHTCESCAEMGGACLFAQPGGKQEG